MDNPYHTVRLHDTTRYIFYASCADKLDSILCSLSWSTLYLSNSLHEDDVLNVNVNVHTIFFFKTCLQYAQLSHDQSLDNSMNNTLVITWSSPFNLEANIWSSSTAYGQILKYNSSKPLVHRRCHQLPKPNMRAHALSIIHPNS